MRIATVQHRIRAHERMDLAALLAMCQEASEDGAALIVCPHVPGLVYSEQMSSAFNENVRSYAPGSAVLTPFASAGKSDPLAMTHSTAGRTLVLGGDECLDTDLYAAIELLAPEMMVWQTETESTLQAEALLELALDASQSQSGLIVIAAHGRATPSRSAAARSSTLARSWPRLATARRSSTRRSWSPSCFRRSGGCGLCRRPCCSSGWLCTGASGRGSTT